MKLYNGPVQPHRIAKSFPYRAPARGHGHAPSLCPVLPSLHYAQGKLMRIPLRRTAVLLVEGSFLLVLVVVGLKSQNNHLGCIVHHVNNGDNGISTTYQPQVVNAGFLNHQMFQAFVGNVTTGTLYRTQTCGSGSACCGFFSQALAIRRSAQQKLTTKKSSKCR